MQPAFHAWKSLVLEWHIDSEQAKRSESDERVLYENSLDDKLEEGKLEEDKLEEQWRSKDMVLHWWIQHRLKRHLWKLQSAANAAPFLDPVPWQELELDDYLEVVETPMDLRTIERRLSDHGYDDQDGFINPELFWSDTALCWDNCFKYYEDYAESEDFWDSRRFEMALAMAEFAETLEDEFWVEFEALEKNIDGTRPSLSSAVVSMDVAAGAALDAVTAAYNSIAAWFQPFRLFKFTALLRGGATVQTQAATRFESSRSRRLQSLARARRSRNAPAMVLTAQRLQKHDGVLIFVCTKMSGELLTLEIKSDNLTRLDFESLVECAESCIGHPVEIVMPDGHLIAGDCPELLDLLVSV